MRTTIYIDDTGNPGEKTNSQYGSKKSKTWVAIILTSDERNDGEEQMNECIECLKKYYNGASEFHFSDIYQGKKEFEGIDKEKRFFLFEKFSDIFKNERFPIRMQTFSEEDYDRVKINKSKSFNQDGFGLNSYNDFALYHLLLLVNTFVKENIKKYPPPYEIIIDEGKKKAGETQFISSIFKKDELFQNKLFYKSSKDTPLLQLADFVAFSLNRCKLLLQNNRKGEDDWWFLKVCENADFQSNLKREMITTNDNTTELYDDLLTEAYIKNSDLSEIGLKEHIKNINK